MWDGSDATQSWFPRFGSVSLSGIELITQPLAITDFQVFPSSPWIESHSQKWLVGQYLLCLLFHCRPERKAGNILWCPSVFFFSIFCAISVIQFSMFHAVLTLKIALLHYCECIPTTLHPRTLACLSLQQEITCYIFLGKCQHLLFFSWQSPWCMSVMTCNYHMRVHPDLDRHTAGRDHADTWLYSFML